jgi:hypothetical protein
VTGKVNITVANIIANHNTIHHKVDMQLQLIAELLQ